MMSCEGVAALVARWREGAQPSTGEHDAFTHHLAGCAACRAALGALAPLLARDAGAAAAGGGAGLPAALEERVMGAVRRQPAPHRAPVAPRALLGAAVAAAAILLAVVGVGTGLLVRERAGAYVTVNFVLDTPAARTVAVAGDFTGWRTSGYELARRPSDGKWEITVRLRRNRSYAYGFVIDGERWVPDPSAPESVDDGFGGANSILRL
jgi:hypothetical protein